MSDVLKMETQIGEGLVQPLMIKKFNPQIIFGLIVVLILGTGVLTGWALSRRSVTGPLQLAPGAEQKGSEVGSSDVKTFKDTAIGVIEGGGLDGEGTHKLIREGGPSQTAYLTSSIIDLDQFAGKKVQVWGETFKGQKAAWLMDVGRVKILE